MFKVFEDWLDLEAVSFPIAHCEHCGGDVLVYARLHVERSRRTLVWRCLFCNAHLDQAQHSVRYDSLMDLIGEAIELEGVDMDDGWPPLTDPAGGWGPDDGAP